jgi:hypothetical protein
MVRQALRLGLFLSISSAHAGISSAAPAKTPPPDSPASIEEVSLHPLFAADFACSEHFEGQLPYLGDALGSDCLVMGGLEAESESDGGYMKLYRTDGKANEDWYGWREPVLSPISGTVDRINMNAVVNSPGQLGKPPATFIVIASKDGTRVLLAHITEVAVKEGDAVRAGQPLGVVGNSGFARSPHIHVGAWRGKSPLQIRFDLRAMAAMRKTP